VKKNIVFLCYSRYVIFVAYLLKRLLGEENIYTLMISDTIGNENGIIDYMKTIPIWDKVEVIKEKGRPYPEVKEQIDSYIRKTKIDCFFVAHIMRYSSHYFLEALPEKVEVNFFDEGSISVDWLSGYRYWTRNGLPKGMPEFDFNRAENFYVLFPEATAEIGRAKIEGIDIGAVLNDNLEKTVADLNLIFRYEYEPIGKEIVVIDSDIAKQGCVTQRYENYCVENTLRELDLEKCTVKIKPSVSEELKKEKYGAYPVTFMKNGVVPFEVVYLNCVLHGDVPKLFVAFPTTLIWNMILINQTMGLRPNKIVSVANIMRDGHFVPGNAEDMMQRISAYQSCLREEYRVEFPRTWAEYAQCIREGEVTREEIKELEEREKTWLWGEYKELLNRKVDNGVEARYRSRMLMKWLQMKYRGYSLASFFKKRNISDFALYGSGEFAELIMQELKGQGIEPTAVVKTECNEGEVFWGYKVLTLDEYAKTKHALQCPIFLTAVGKEDSQECELRKRGMVGIGIRIEEILKVVSGEE